MPYPRSCKNLKFQIPSQQQSSLPHPTFPCLTSPSLVYLSQRLRRAVLHALRTGRLPERERDQIRDRPQSHVMFKKYSKKGPHRILTRPPRPSPRPCPFCPIFAPFSKTIKKLRILQFTS